MDKYEKNIQIMKTMFSLIKDLDKDNENNKEKQILMWIKQDLIKIINIQNEIKEMKLLKYSYKMKKITNIEKIEEYVKTNNILEIYKIVNNELENWKNISIKIKLCYSQLKN